jgi:peptidyl-prolyl cis-trans isomerase A (cyclophilin A)
VRLGATLLGLVASCAASALAQSLPRVRLETELGSIEIEIDSVAAPRTSANFLRYLDGGWYRNGLFHRTVTLANQPDNPVKIEVIQASADTSRRPGFEPIPLERTSVTGLAHRAGTVSMARAGPDTARDQFFICVTDQPELDFGGKRNPDGQGFAAFGRVVSGMNVVRSIQARPAQGQRLTPPVKIVAAARVR